MELTYAQADKLRKQYGTPLYVYDETILRQAARKFVNLPAAFGKIIPRFAMKSCSSQAVLQILDEEGMWFDASSGFEAERAILAGLPPHKISLSTQHLTEEHILLLYPKQVHINACSLDQLKRFARLFPNREIGLRINPGFGGGHSKKATVAGKSASFGIWHEHIDKALAIVEQHSLKVDTVHIHVGSGVCPDIWQNAADYVVNSLIPKFNDIKRLNLGGGFKVARMPTENTTDVQLVAEDVKQLFLNFAERNGRELELEIEPGTAVVAQAGCLLATIQDATGTRMDEEDDTDQGMDFLKLDTGMSEILRPTVYGSQHLITVLKKPGEYSNKTKPFVICGHCCESGDLLSVAPGDSSAILQRELDSNSGIGDICIIHATGAYCSSMSAKNYNSFPEAAEVMLRDSRTDNDGLRASCLIRKRQTLDQMTQNEISLKMCNETQEL